MTSRMRPDDFPLDLDLYFLNLDEFTFPQDDQKSFYEQSKTEVSYMSNVLSVRHHIVWQKTWHVLRRQRKKSMNFRFYFS